MDRWIGQVAVVTGASAGIGAAISKVLVEQGLKVVGISKRRNRIEELARALNGRSNGRFFPLRCDVAKEDCIQDAFKWILDNLGPMHILVNNAHLARSSSLINGEADEWRKVFEVNVMAVCICTREAVKIMKDNGIAGQIIHMNSAVSILPKSALNVYPATKSAVITLADSLRDELETLGTGIKVTIISPGRVTREYIEENSYEELNNSHPVLSPNDVADAVVYVLSSGPHVQVEEIKLCPIAEKV